jgi:RNA polymerase sigma-70 factor (ECF subfamily)
MPADDPKKPSATQLVTEQGVEVRVRPHRVTARAPEKKVERAPRVVVRPPRSPREERDSFIRRVVDEHGPFLLSMLGGPRVNPASAEEMRQELLIALDRWIDENGLPENDEAFLARMAVNQRRNRSRHPRVAVDDGVEVDEAVTSAPDPERALDLAQRGVWLDTHVDQLSEVERKVVQLVDRDGLSINKAAAKLGRPPGTISTQLTRARDKLEDFALESDRAAEAGKRRRPGR